MSKHNFSSQPVNHSLRKLDAPIKNIQISKITIILRPIQFSKTELASNLEEPQRVLVMNQRPQTDIRLQNNLLMMHETIGIPTRRVDNAPREAISAVQIPATLRQRFRVDVQRMRSKRQEWHVRTERIPLLPEGNRFALIPEDSYPTSVPFSAEELPLKCIRLTRRSLPSLEEAV